MRGVLRRIGYDVIRWPAGTAEGAELTRLLESLQVTTVMDVGAYIGEWSAGLRRLGYANAIVSFEPSPSSYARLRDAAADDALWDAVHAAVGAEHGVADLFSPSESANVLAPRDRTAHSHPLR